MAVETRVVIDANAQNAIKEINKLDEAAKEADTTIKTLDDQTVTVGVNADGMDELRRKGDEAIAQVKALSDQKVVIDVDADKLDRLGNDAAPHAKRGLDDVGKSADSSKSVLANMVGNATQDLGALGGVAGSAGVAIGQMGEYMADAKADGEGFGSIAKNFGAMVGPIAAISAATIVATKAFASMADTKAFNKKQVEDFVDALEDVKNEATAVLEVIKEAGGVKGRAGGFLGVFEGTKDITADLVAARVSADEFIAAVTEGGPALDAVKAKLEAAKDAATQAFKDTGDEQAFRKRMTELNDSIEIVGETFKNYDQTKKDNVASDEFLATSTAKTAEEMDKLWDAAKQAGKDADDLADAEKNAADRAEELRQGFKKAATAAHDLIDANEFLRGSLENKSAYLSLQDTFDDVKIKGQQAWDAQVTGASDAEVKMREFEQAQIDAKNEVIDFYEQLQGLPPQKTTQIFALIDEGSFDEAERRMAVLYRNRTMEVSIVAKGAIGFSVDTRTGGIRPPQGGGFPI